MSSWSRRVPLAEPVDLGPGGALRLALRHDGHRVQGIREDPRLPREVRLPELRPDLVGVAHEQVVERAQEGGR